MKLIRIALGLIVCAYGLLLTIPILNVGAYKLGLMRHIKPAAVRMVPLWQATQLWHIILWVVGAALMLAAGVQVIRGRHGFRIFVVAFVEVAGLWWIYRQLPQYGQAFTLAELHNDYYTLSFMLLVGAGIWLVERRPTAQKAAA